MAPRIGLIVQLFLRASRVQHKRAALTIAAIAWGSLTLLLLLAFGEGLKRQMLLARIGMGTNLAIVWPGETGRAWQGLPPGRPIRPRLEDIEFLESRLPGDVVGEIKNWETSFSYAGKTVNGMLTGASWRYGELRNFIARPGGRFLNALDETGKRRVAFVGDERAKELFGEEEPVGKTLLINSTPYTVIGVMKKKLQMGTYGGPDATNVVIPITTYKAQFGTERLGNIVLRARTPEEMPLLLRSFRAAMGGRYRFDPEDERVFGIWDTVGRANVLGNMLLGIEVFLGVIGGLTLIVGGVGVANIMYAVVKERTREIGVKMALGARPGWITAPIVLEAVTYTVAGGLLGTVAAVLIVSLLGMLPTEGNQALEFLGKPTLSMPIGLAAAGVLGAIGLLAGYFPARRAATIDPAQTLRYE
ncbi:MAG: ABC transporter permease [Acidobacteria bacterium]|nr:ABC transporter permease [Acidobacteriota bacterium]